MAGRAEAGVGEPETVAIQSATLAADLLNALERYAAMGQRQAPPSNDGSNEPVVSSRHGADQPAQPKPEALELQEYRHPTAPASMPEGTS